MTQSPPPTAKITAIIAAYNEAPRIAAVLRVITSYPHFTQTIVVDDDSTDNTGQIAQRFPITYLKNEVNRGKGAAMDRAVAQAQSDIIFFCDADVQGLTHDIITQLLSPVIDGSKDMSIAMRHHTTLQWWPWLMRFIFLLGGERALTKKLWQEVPAYYKHQFRIEPALNFYAAHYGRGFACFFYPVLRQPSKNTKFGLLAGNQRRVAFVAQIIATRLRLAFIRDQRVKRSSELFAKTLDHH